MFCTGVADASGSVSARCADTAGLKNCSLAVLLVGIGGRLEEGWVREGKRPRAFPRSTSPHITREGQDFSRRLRADACALGVPFAHEDGREGGLLGPNYALQVTENKPKKDFTTSVTEPEPIVRLRVALFRHVDTLQPMAVE